MLFSIVKDPVISANTLNNDLDIIYQWAHQWKMEFNPDPTKQATEVLFSCKKVSPNHPQLIFNGNDVVKVNEQKHLGLILQPGLSFDNNTISYLKEKLPANCKEMFNGIIRTTFHAIMCKSNRYKKSFFPNAVASWNLFMEIFNYKVVPSIGVLKNDIISLIRPVAKSVFKIHDPAGLRYIFQLRVGLSPLKVHKWCHNFIDAPSGGCHCNQGIEDTSHVLLSCPFYVIQPLCLV